MAIHDFPATLTNTEVTIETGGTRQAGVPAHVQEAIRGAKIILATREVSVATGDVVHYHYDDDGTKRSKTYQIQEIEYPGALDAVVLYVAVASRPTPLDRLDAPTRAEKHLQKYESFGLDRPFVECRRTIKKLGQLGTHERVGLLNSLDELESSVGGDLRELQPAYEQFTMKASEYHSLQLFLLPMTRQIVRAQ